MPTVSSVTYDSVTTSTESLTLETETRYSMVSGKDRLEKWLNLDKDAIPKVETITIESSLPVADCYYRVAIDGPTANADRVYLYEFLTASTDTSATIAAKLAELIDTSVDVSAVASGSTVVITAVLPGTNGAFTATVACKAKSDDSSISSKIATATTTAASGTGKLRKLAQFDLSLGVKDGFPEFKIESGIWYNGAASPVSAQTFGPFPFTGNIKYDAYRAVA